MFKNINIAQDISCNLENFPMAPLNSEVWTNAEASTLDNLHVIFLTAHLKKILHAIDFVALLSLSIYCENMRLKLV